MNKYKNLEQTAANHSALTPLTLLQRAAGIYPDKAAVIDGDITRSYREFYQRCRQMAVSRFPRRW
jgi:fatty-acyl-CoA synthase